MRRRTHPRRGLSRGHVPKEPTSSCRGGVAFDEATRSTGKWSLASGSLHVTGRSKHFRVLLLLYFPSLASPNALSRRAGKHSRTVGALPLENRCELLAVTFWSCCFLTIAIVRLRAGPGRTRVPRLPSQFEPIQIVLSEHQVPSGELSHQACRRRFRWHGLHDV